MNLIKWHFTSQYQWNKLKIIQPARPTSLPVVPNGNLFWQVAFGKVIQKRSSFAMKSMEKFFIKTDRMATKANCTKFKACMVMKTEFRSCSNVLSHFQLPQRYYLNDVYRKKYQGSTACNRSRRLRFTGLQHAGFTSLGVKVCVMKLHWSKLQPYWNLSSD